MIRPITFFKYECHNFRTFVKQYGTHYVEEVQMGAQLIIETRFASRTNSTTETTKRLKCIVNAASSNASVGVETQDIEVSGGVPGVPVSASTTIKGLKDGYTSGHAFKDQKYVYYDKEGPHYLNIDYLY